MAANREMIKASIVVAGFCINQRGGAYIHGTARPLQDKAAVAQKHFELEESLWQVNVFWSYRWPMRVLLVGGLLIKL
jgi:hypothetical protein